LHTLFGRAELVGKPAEDLHLHEYGARVFAAAKAQIGYVRQLGSWNAMQPGVGGTYSLSIVPTEFSAAYSGRVAPGFGVFVSLRPASHDM
jgi:hypothetical protein